MGLNLHIDQRRWRAHLTAFATEHPELVPVIKGNGYGLGTLRLAREATLLGCQTIAAGTAAEAVELRTAFAGEILILTPLEPIAPIDGAIYTLSSLETVAAWSSTTPVVVEILTDTKRHGVPRTDFRRLAAAIENLDCRGLAFHLPLTPARNPQEMVSGELSEIFEAGIPVSSFDATVWLSHIPLEALTALRHKYPSLIFRERVGTALWLGSQSALRATATVLDRHRVTAGERVGYRQRRLRMTGWLIVAAGGTHHGIGLESPPSDLSVLGRLKIIARAVLAVAGSQLSPYSFNGRRLRFAEPPHMQSSMLLLRGSSAPEIGSELEVGVRHTTTHFDVISER